MRSSRSVGESPVAGPCPWFEVVLIRPMLFSWGIRKLGSHSLFN